MNPSQVLTELVNAVLAWEEADSLRLKLVDSKSAKLNDLTAANLKLISSIKRLRAAAREVRKLIKSPIKKKKRPIDWSKIIDTTAKVVGAVKDIKDRTTASTLPAGIDPSKVVDMKP